WAPSTSLEVGLRSTYEWVKKQVAKDNKRGVCTAKEYCSSKVVYVNKEQRTKMSMQFSTSPTNPSPIARANGSSTIKKSIGGREEERERNQDSLHIGADEEEFVFTTTS